MKKYPLFLVIFCLTISSFSQEKVEKSYVYTSADTKGFISVKKTELKNETGVSTTLQTKVNTTFDGEVLNFNLSTINDSDKMVAPSKLIFDGTIDSNMKPVSFTGNRIKKDKKNNSYWSFEGDFKDEMETDPDFKRYTTAKHNATLRIPDRTIPTFNLWAIIPKLQFDRNGTFVFNSLDETKLYVKKNQTVNYLGKTKTSINGKAKVLHKFVHQGKGMIPAYYWVNDDHELVQVLLDNKFTFTLDRNYETAKAFVDNND